TPGRHRLRAACGSPDPAAQRRDPGERRIDQVLRTVRPRSRWDAPKCRPTVQPLGPTIVRPCLRLRMNLLTNAHVQNYGHITYSVPMEGIIRSIRAVSTVLVATPSSELSIPVRTR